MDNSPAESRRSAFAASVRRRKFILAPGVYDFVSMKLAERVGFDALYLSGYGLCASQLGLPDAGLATFSEMLSAVRGLSAATTLPVIADADTGFGGLLNIQRTVQAYEGTAACAIQLEDQTFPKKCGHISGREVVDTEIMQDRIRVACEARNNPDFMIIARTDARTSRGLDVAIARARSYLEAGADIIFVESPEGEAEFARIAAEIDAPLLANMVDGGRSPVLPSQTLAAMGYTIAIYPVFALMAAVKAMTLAFEQLARCGWSAQSAERLEDFASLSALVGFPAVAEFERRWPSIRSAPGKP